MSKKTIEDIKLSLTVKALAGNQIEKTDILKFLQLDGIEEFVCNLSAKAAYLYAELAGPSLLSRKRASKDPDLAYAYACYIDKRAYPITREGAYKGDTARWYYKSRFPESKKKKRKVKKCQKDTQDKKISSQNE
jgi:hypothetical protein